VRFRAVHGASRRVLRVDIGAFGRLSGGRSGCKVCRDDSGDAGGRQETAYGASRRSTRRSRRAAGVVGLAAQALTVCSGAVLGVWARASWGRQRLVRGHVARRAVPRLRAESGHGERYALRQMREAGRTSATPAEPLAPNPKRGDNAREGWAASTRRSIGAAFMTQQPTLR
jgi:hypothetical protein